MEDATQVAPRYTGNALLDIVYNLGVKGGNEHLQGIFPWGFLARWRGTRAQFLAGLHVTRDAIVVIEEQSEQGLQDFLVWFRAQAGLLSVVGVRARPPQDAMVRLLFYEVLTEVLRTRTGNLVRLDVGLAFSRRGGLMQCLTAVQACRNVVWLRVDAQALLEHRDCQMRVARRVHGMVQRMLNLRTVKWTGFHRQVGVDHHFLRRIHAPSIEGLALSGSCTPETTLENKTALRNFLASDFARNMSKLDCSEYIQLDLDRFNADHLFSVASSPHSVVSVIKLPTDMTAAFWWHGENGVGLLAGQFKRLTDGTRVTVIVTNTDQAESRRQADMVWLVYTGWNVTECVRVLEWCHLTASERVAYEV